MKIVCGLLLCLALAGFCREQSAGRSVIAGIKFKNGESIVQGTVSAPSPCPVNIDCGDREESYFIKGVKGASFTLKLSSQGGNALFSIFSPANEILKRGSGVNLLERRISDGRQFYGQGFYENRYDAVYIKNQEGKINLISRILRNFKKRIFPQYF